MEDLIKYQKAAKKNFVEGKKLYNKYGKNIVPDFEKYLNFFEKVDKDTQVSAQGILDSKIAYIIRMGKQDEFNAKKKEEPEQTTTIKTEDPNQKQKSKAKKK